MKKNEISAREKSKEIPFGATTKIEIGIRILKVSILL